jgi:hypothetical protein
MFGTSFGPNAACIWDFGILLGVLHKSKLSRPHHVVERGRVVGLALHKLFSIFNDISESATIWHSFSTTRHTP